MNKFKKSQLIVLSLLTILLIIAPLLSSPIRLTYIYFITNILIIVLGAEAGLLSFFAHPSLDHNTDKKTTFFSETPSMDKRVISPNGNDQEKVEKKDNKSIRVVEKCLSEKVVGSVKALEKVKRCPSMPSLFFIGGGDNEADLDHHEDYYHQDDEHEDQKIKEEQEENINGEISGQELFAKAENFIGNFYKQLKMQREDSWKRIHGFVQRAF